LLNVHRQVDNANNAFIQTLKDLYLKPEESADFTKLPE